MSAPGPESPLAIWVEICADFAWLGDRKSDLTDDDNDLILVITTAVGPSLPWNKPFVARKYQLGNGLLFEEGVDWCYGRDAKAVTALLAARALT